MVTKRPLNKPVSKGRRPTDNSASARRGRRAGGFWRPVHVPTALVLVLVCTKCANPGCSSPALLEASGSILAAAPRVRLANRDLAQQAQDDPIALLEEGLSRSRLDCYDGEFVIQERLNGRLNKPVTSHFKFRSDPFSVAMRRLRGKNAITRLVYVEGRNDGKMIVRPSGLLGKVTPSVEVDPHGAMARRNSRYAITDFGLENALRRLLKAYKEAASQNQLQSECLGVGELEGRTVVTLRKTGPTGVTLADLDADTLLPVRVRTYTADEKLMGYYQYKHLRFSCVLAEADFSKEANGLAQ